MINELYGILKRYFNALEYTGYLPHEVSEKMLLIGFYIQFIEQYKHLFTDEDRCLVRCALDCLDNRNTCFSFYSQYLKW